MKLGRWHRLLVLMALIAVGLTGLVWFLLHDVFGREPGALLRGLMTAHGVASFAALMAFGSVLPLHSVAGWRQKRNLCSGIAAVAALGGLALTGLGLYYAGEETREASRLIHLALGFAAVILLPAHVAGYLRSRLWRDR